MKLLAVIYCLGIGLVLVWMVAVQFEKFRWAVLRYLDRYLDRRAKRRELIR